VALVLADRKASVDEDMVLRVTNVLSCRPYESRCAAAGVVPASLFCPVGTRGYRLK
jgi:hypothetical protein